MKQIFLLNQSNLQLSKAEVLALTNTKEQELHNHLLILDNTKHLHQRLAFTKSIYQHLFTIPQKDLKSTIESFDWNSVYNTSFAVRTFNLRQKEETIASMIWTQLKKPKVNLQNPTSTYHFYKVKSQIIAGRLLYNIPYNYDERKAHNRPQNHPTSLHPQLARAMINLTGIQEGTILDPFCGSGGILIEAALMNLTPIGHDINSEMITRARYNLRAQKLSPKISKKDATTLEEPIDYLATDLPYALNSKTTDLNTLYSSFITTLTQILKKRAVIGFPSFYNYKKIINKTDLKIEHEFTIPLHKSLSKKIVVISP